MTPCPRQLDRIMQVMSVAFDPAYGEAWNRRQVSDALTLASTHALVISTEGTLIPDGPSRLIPAGFTLTRHAADEEELLLIAVDPQHRRRGLGEQLIGHLFDAARQRGITRVFLEMRRGNPAIALYGKLGFAPIGERLNYYRTPSGERIDAITFGKTLEP
ncbi:GNAT family N-acetyltransferase [Erythrobacter sp. T5W1-R]|uniref:GNAT family N-acetyltransferase n=1 Tax=Erythrobacter sp. T5W1-R TaxID=3101752 RepID=UPI002AFE2EB4|nr:GNAT family N-acetyltransferase [Erythrobacter sp. T5W1-R]MEA1617761.1 GNAT family N-acetyltransferase [Erythrobacter sp. T5W1-R]